MIRSFTAWCLVTIALAVPSHLAGSAATAASEQPTIQETQRWLALNLPREANGSDEDTAAILEATYSFPRPCFLSVRAHVETVSNAQHMVTGSYRVVDLVPRSGLSFQEGARQRDEADAPWPAYVETGIIDLRKVDLSRVEVRRVEQWSLAHDLEHGGRQSTTMISVSGSRASFATSSEMAPRLAAALRHIVRLCGGRVDNF
jgi:hypothetical protein